MHHIGFGKILFDKEITLFSFSLNSCNLFSDDIFKKNFGDAL